MSRPRETRLPVLGAVNIQRPCHENWESMSGDEAQRFCQSCQKHVYRLAEMDSQDVVNLFRSADPVCVRMQRRADGSIVTRDGMLNDGGDVRSPVMNRRGWLVRVGQTVATTLAAIPLLSFFGMRGSSGRRVAADGRSLPARTSVE